MSDRRDRIREKILSRCVRDGDCLLWTGPDSGKGRGGGYPRMNLEGGTIAVHIAFWVVEHGPIPPKKQLDHTCRKRRCIWHLELVTHKRNQKRRADARRYIIK